MPRTVTCRPAVYRHQPPDRRLGGRARAEGADVIAGGARPAGEALQDGCYEQGEPGLRFYTRLKTAAVRSAW